MVHLRWVIKQVSYFPKCRDSNDLFVSIIKIQNEEPNIPFIGN